ncbi:MAG: hypothetical protein KDD89_17005, partial [Anaerolineales bacterium]|nr:hypothetical protein [Anaerolineales bacterium]
ILRFDLSTLGEPYAVFANAPFNITSELLTHLFRPTGGPAVAHLILQTEALIGRNKAGIPVETFKSLLIKPLYEVTAVYHFSRSDFRPQPSVDTALFRFVRRTAPTVKPAHYDLYQDFLSFVAQDRVGEGAWLKLFSKKQLQLMTSRTELVPNRGLKSQSFTAVVAAFETFVAFCGPKHAVVKDSMSQLRHTQQQTQRHNAQ